MRCESYVQLYLCGQFVWVKLPWPHDTRRAAQELGPVIVSLEHALNSESQLNHDQLLKFFFLLPLDLVGQRTIGSTSIGQHHHIVCRHWDTLHHNSWQQTGERAPKGR